LRVKLEQAQVQMREWEAAAARLEAKNDRLQVSGGHVVELTLLFGVRRSV
jgi:hypothetical protein